MMSIARMFCIALGAMSLLIIAARTADEIMFPEYRFGADATDGPGKRSGLSLRTDWETGCQYLESRYGGLTPRLDADGRHICKVAP